MSCSVTCSQDRSRSHPIELIQINLLCDHTDSLNSTRSYYVYFSSYNWFSTALRMSLQGRLKALLESKSELESLFFVYNYIYLQHTCTYMHELVQWILLKLNVCSYTVLCNVLFMYCSKVKWYLLWRVLHTCTCTHSIKLVFRGTTANTYLHF